jgi:molybdopterin converting factor small subunit
VLRLFAGAREAAGLRQDDVPGATVGEVIDAACERYGEPFVQVVEHCQIWRNGAPCERTDVVSDSDEVAVLPPVSGGAG